MKKDEVNIEDIIIVCMSKSVEFLRYMSKVLVPEYFESDFCEILSRILIEYFNKSGEVPEDDLIGLIELNLHLVPDEDKRILLRTFTQNVLGKYKHMPLNFVYVETLAREFIKRKGLEYNIRKIQHCIKLNRYKEAYALLENTQVNVIRKLSKIERFNDFDNLLYWWNKKEENMIKFPGDLGNYLPRIEPGRLYVMFGPAKRGKTFWLMEWFYQGIVNRRNCLYFSLEMSKGEVDERFKSKITQQEFRADKISSCFPVVDCIHNQSCECDRDERPKNSKPVINVSNGVLEDWKKNQDHIICTHCRFIPELKEFFHPSHWAMYESFEPMTLMSAVKAQKGFDIMYGDSYRYVTYPIGTVTIRDIENDIKEYESVRGMPPDVVIIDYADIIKKDTSVSDKAYIQTGNIWMQLSALAKSKNIVVVTASQGNRGSSNKNRLEPGDIAEDWSKVTILDGLFAINEENFNKKSIIDTDSYWGIQRIESLVSRGAKIVYGRQCVTLCDMGRGQIVMDSYII